MKAPNAHSILIFDPDARSELRIARILNEAGYHTAAASTLAEPDGAMFARRSQLVLSSFRLGQYNGLDLALHCLAVAPATPLLVIGPADDHVLAQEAARLGLQFAPISTGAAELVALITDLVGPAHDSRH